MSLEKTELSSKVLNTSEIVRLRHRLSIVRPEVRDGCYLLQDVIKELPILQTSSYNCTMVKLYGSEHVHDLILQELNEDLIVLLRRREVIIVSTLKRMELLVIYGEDYEYDFMDNGIVLKGDIQKMNDQSLEFVFNSISKSLSNKEGNEYGN